MDAILLATPAGRILETNPAFCELAGYADTELVGMSAGRLFVSGTDWRRFLRRVKDVGGVQAFEAILRCKDGSVRKCLVTATIRQNAEGKPICLQAIACEPDDTRLAKELAERLARERLARAAAEEARGEALDVLESIPDIFFALDSRGRVRYVNEAGRRFARDHFSTKPEDVIGSVIWELSPAFSGTRFEDEYSTMVSALIPCRFEEFFHGWGVWLDIRLSPARKGFSVWIQDVTERKRLEEQLRLSQRLEAVGRLTNGIAHDFNNLLTVIRGNAQLLQMELPDGTPEYGDALEIAGAATRAASLIEQLLAFSRQREMDEQVVDLNHLVREVVRMLDRVLLGTIEIDTRFASDLEMVVADPGQMHQVIMNVAVNARDAMPNGGRITITTANAELTAQDAARYPYRVEPGAYVRLRVQDTGIGMDAETQARVFEPFFTTKRRTEGTGLGLSTVYGIVKKSRGYVWVHSEVGRGTTVEIYLPRSRSAVT